MVNSSEAYLLQQISREASDASQAFLGEIYSYPSFCTPLPLSPISSGLLGDSSLPNGMPAPLG